MIFYIIYNLQLFFRYEYYLCFKGILFRNKNETHKAGAISDCGLAPTGVEPGVRAKFDHEKTTHYRRFLMGLRGDCVKKICQWHVFSTKREQSLIAVWLRQESNPGFEQSLTMKKAPIIRCFLVGHRGLEPRTP